MKKVIYLCLSSFILLGCKNSIEEIPVAAEAQANTEKAISEQQNLGNQTNVFQQDNKNTGLQLPTTTNTNVNPPHGQPGHRCDLAVGAPLPTNYDNLPKTVQETNQNTNEPITKPIVMERSSNINPPHGQPGHRCDIAVGAPLDSQPQQAKTTQPVQAAQQQVVVNPQQKVTQTAEGFSGKPNPAHGQPGHRCDIAVGETLP